MNENNKNIKLLWDKISNSNEENIYNHLASFINIESLGLSKNTFREYVFIALSGSENRNSFYRSIKIKKKRGGFRELHIPTRILKAVQYYLLKNMSLIFNPHKCSYAFEYSKSIKDHAAQHVKKKYVYTLDLVDFFGSINWGRLNGCFQAYPFNLNNISARILANIFIYKDSLPQGAPSSPFLANMICRSLDAELYRWAIKNKFNYSRYADDITFSTNLNSITKEVLEEIKVIIKKAGFTINTAKERLMPYYQKQMVTGLIVNRKVNVPRAYIRNIRATLHNLSISDVNSQLIRKTYFNSPDDINKYNSRAFSKNKYQKIDKVQSNNKFLLDPIVAINHQIINNKFKKTINIKVKEDIKNLDEVNIFSEFVSGDLTDNKISTTKKVMYSETSPQDKFLESLKGKIEFIGFIKGKTNNIYKTLLQKYNQIIEKGTIEPSIDDETKLKGVQSTTIKDKHDAKVKKYEIHMLHKPILTTDLFTSFTQYEKPLRNLLHAPDESELEISTIYKEAYEYYSSMKPQIKPSIRKLILELLSIYRNHNKGYKFLNELWDKEDFQKDLTEIYKKSRFGKDGHKYTDLKNLINGIITTKKFSHPIQFESFDDIYIYTPDLKKALTIIISMLKEKFIFGEHELEIIGEKNKNFQLIKIKHINSFIDKDYIEFINKIDKGNGEFGKCKLLLKNICDWSIISKFNNGKFYKIWLLDKDHNKAESFFEPFEQSNKDYVEHIIKIYVNN